MGEQVRVSVRVAKGEKWLPVVGVVGTSLCEVLIDEDYLEVIRAQGGIIEQHTTKPVATLPVDEVSADEIKPRRGGR